MNEAGVLCKCLKTGGWEQQIEVLFTEKSRPDIVLEHSRQSGRQPIFLRKRIKVELGGGRELEQKEGTGAAGQFRQLGCGGYLVGGVKLMQHGPDIDISVADFGMKFACSLRVATYVSARNECQFCETAHGAVAAVHLNGNEDLVCSVKQDYRTAGISDKLTALLYIGGKVQQGGKFVLSDDVEEARRHGATDHELHGTVLIAAAFCMYNRYVDGLGAWTPADASVYRGIGQKLAEQGYEISKVLARSQC